VCFTRFSFKKEVGNPVSEVTHFLKKVIHATNTCAPFAFKSHPFQVLNIDFGTPGQSFVDVESATLLSQPSAYNLKPFLNSPRAKKSIEGAWIDNRFAKDCVVWRENRPLKNSTKRTKSHTF
jgi:hypothetical protein